MRGPLSASTADSLQTDRRHSGGREGRGKLVCTLDHYAIGTAKADMFFSDLKEVSSQSN